MHRFSAHLATRLSACVFAVGLAFGVSACVVNEENGHPEGWQDIQPEPDPDVVALVPPEIADTGVITLATNPPFAPAEFKDSHGQIIGFDIDLARAAAATMGLTLEVRQQDFNMILPAISSGTIDFGASGMTDNEERRRKYDFVDYLTAGIQWAAPPDSGIDPDNACGLTVAVQRGTVSESDDVPARSEACEAAGKEPITMLAYDDSDSAALAAVLGRADAFSADSPISAWAVERSEGKIELIGDITDAAHYGWPVDKGSPLAPALAAALQSLIDSGDYETIMTQWGISSGLAENAKINGAAI
ncbi:Glutamine-binding periplasmic protein precursor [Corynebacterium ciconiae DSM 44920]|uniref:ABC transporter substrate-binding protein n=1 Tax=Corynebacterium ciconiae TaxID=227319 RepID=UPI00068724AB|nr:ABC transporter substrate-binding protein [Corynebacterium ciconiae]WKD61076.1 Glutamine-binding periplasmic protein precursor [Corynebacterium ciconiae DSM 44920]